MLKKGCTVDLVQEHIPRYGIEVITVDTSNVENVKKNFKPNTKVVYLESPANPTNKISDIESISKYAHEHGAIVAVDGTFSSPYFIKPLKLGADIALHSMTKYLGGHGDVLGGIVTVKTEEHLNICRSWRKVTGSLLAPFDAFLVMRGIRTLAIRMEKVQSNTNKIIGWLKEQPEIEAINYPGLSDFPGHDIAIKQMSGFGGTFSFTMKGGYEAAKKLLENVHLCTVAVSLGCADTLIEHPASMTHACVPEELMKKQGLTRNMIRISVGLENPDDIINDLKQAIEKIKV